MQTLIEKK